MTNTCYDDGVIVLDVVWQHAVIIRFAGWDQSPRTTFPMKSICLAAIMLRTRGIS